MWSFSSEIVRTAVWCLLMGAVWLQEVSVSGRPSEIENIHTINTSVEKVPIYVQKCHKFIFICTIKLET